MKSKLYSHFLVFIQYLGSFLVLLKYGDTKQNSFYFLIISIIGSTLGFYTLMHNRIGNFNSYPELLDNTQLITSGPYKHIRHPMYFSLTLFILGFALFRNHWINYAIFVLVVISMKLKIIKEEKLLHEKFPEYKEYMKNTKIFFPFLY